MDSSHDEEYSNLIASKGNVIYESKYFVVVPSFGPLHLSHVMLVPRMHATCFFDLPPEALSESQMILKNLAHFYRNKTGRNLIFFESGAGRLVNHSGGCIVHAHIHCLEENIAFSERLRHETTLLKVEKGNLSLDREFGYIWYKDSDGLEYYCNKPLLPSQFLRYIYAQCSSDSTVWNWRKSINFPRILKVIEMYSDLKILSNNSHTDFLK